MKRIVAALLVACLVFALCGCAKSDYSNDFFNYLAKKNELVGGCLSAPSGAKIGNMAIERETEDYSFDVLVNATFEMLDENEENCYATLDFDIIMADALYLSDLAIEFAKSRNWSNSYHLYIQLGASPTFVYDYEASELYYSIHLDKYIGMYYAFGTTEPKKLASLDDEAASQYLIDNNFGKIRHNELELSGASATNDILLYIVDNEFSSWTLDYFASVYVKD